MLGRLKRAISRRLFRRNSQPQTQDLGDQSVSEVYIEENPVVINEDEIIVKRGGLEDSLPIIERLADMEEKIIPRRKVTNLEWNGPMMEIAGYFYLEGIPVLDEDLVKKRCLEFI